MKQLALLRHAKSSWDNPALDDFDRPLNERGKSAAPLIGSHMAGGELCPDHILCSTAKRTRETLALLLDELPNTPTVAYSDALYLASPETLLAAIKTAPEGASRLLVIAHNPGLHELAVGLTDNRQSDKETLQRLCAKFPTAALATISFNCADWRHIEFNTGRLENYVTPKKLSR